MVAKSSKASERRGALSSETDSVVVVGFGLWKFIRESLDPLRANGSENDDHAWAKARIVYFLRRYASHYRVRYEHPMPCYDPEYFPPYADYKADVYAETKNGEDKIVFEIGGFSDGSYHGKSPKSISKTLNKKERICNHYQIDHARYFILEKYEIFSKDYILSDEELLDKFQLLSKAAVTRRGKE